MVSPIVSFRTIWEVPVVNFWNLRQRLGPKMWPKEGQNFSKFKKFKTLDKDKKDY